jgi:uncharacterized FlaG/YvyC family protein
MKKFLIGVLIGCLLMMTTPVLADSILQSIDVVLNGVNVQLEGEDVDVNSILYNGSTYLPMRKVAELVGKDIEWKQETMTANIVERREIETMETDEFIIHYNENDDSDFYAEKDGEVFLLAWRIGELMDKDGVNGKYGIDINNLHVGNVRFYDKDGETVIENIPYEMINDRICISKDYYENTILPLIQK